MIKRVKLYGWLRNGKTNYGTKRYYIGGIAKKVRLSHILPGWELNPEMKNRWFVWNWAGGKSGGRGFWRRAIPSMLTLGGIARRNYLTSIFIIRHIQANPAGMKKEAGEQWGKLFYNDCSNDFSTGGILKNWRLSQNLFIWRLKGVAGNRELVWNRF